MYRRVRNREEAEDLTQEVYLRIAGRFGAASPPLPCLLAAARNLVGDHWRRAAPGPLPLEEEHLVAHLDGDDAVTRLWLEDLLRRLTAEYRAVLGLRVIGGHSRAETARRLGRSEASVRGLQYRALQRLRQLVLNDGVEEESHQ